MNIRFTNPAIEPRQESPHHNSGRLEFVREGDCVVITHIGEYSSSVLLQSTIPIDEFKKMATFLTD